MVRSDLSAWPAETAGGERGEVVEWTALVAAERRFGALERLAADVASGERPACAVLWRASPALVVTRSESRLPGFEAASRRLARDGLPVIVRRSGGGAFPIGPGTLQIALLSRRSQAGLSFEHLYDHLAAVILEALASLGLTAVSGEIAGAFCPGRYDVSVKARKIAGLAQHWSGNGAVIGEASLLVEGDLVASVDAVNRFHELAGSPRRCNQADCISLRGALTGAADDVLPALLTAMRRTACPSPRRFPQPSSCARG